MSSLDLSVKTDFNEIKSDATSNIINILFKELRSIFPAFRISWPTDKEMSEAKKTWTKAFVAAGINKVEQIRYGVNKARLSADRFVPSAGEFIKWCKPTPEEMGMLSHEKAYEEAVKNSYPIPFEDMSWSHITIKHARDSCGSNNLYTLPREKMAPLFSHYYEQALSLYKDNKLTDIPKRAIPEKIAASTPERAREEISKIRNILK